MRKYYKAEMDRQLRLTTRLAGFGMAAAAVLLCFTWYKFDSLCPPPPGFMRWAILLAAAVVAVSAWLAKAMAPRGYSLDDVELAIDRKVKPITIPLRDIAQANQLEEGVFSRSLRVMGTSGYYGHYGLFWSRKIGFFRAYATRFDRLAAVRTAKTLFVLSPDDTEDFLKTLGSLILR
ncbi:MAG: hypothetical protein HY952_03030 [Elusimicrobia bacterium]|nr:hypothetical protein [Elusimicrobiota bacterium]